MLSKVKNLGETSTTPTYTPQPRLADPRKHSAPSQPRHTSSSDPRHKAPSHLRPTISLPKKPVTQQHQSEISWQVTSDTDAGHGNEKVASKPYEVVMEIQSPDPDDMQVWMDFT